MAGISPSSILGSAAPHSVATGASAHSVSAGFSSASSDSAPSPSPASSDFSPSSPSSLPSSRASSLMPSRALNRSSSSEDSPESPSAEPSSPESSPKSSSPTVSAPASAGASFSPSISRVKESSPPSSGWTSPSGSPRSSLNSSPVAPTPIPSSGLASSAGASSGTPPGAGGRTALSSAAGAAGSAAPSELVKSTATPDGWASDTFCVERRLSEPDTSSSMKETTSCGIWFSPLMTTAAGMRSSRLTVSRPSAFSCSTIWSTTKALVSSSISDWPTFGKLGIPSGWSFTTTSRMLSGVYSRGSSVGSLLVSTPRPPIASHTAFASSMANTSVIAFLFCSIFDISFVPLSQPLRLNFQKVYNSVKNFKPRHIPF